MTTEETKQAEPIDDGVSVIRHADGVYIGLPIKAYVRDDAVGGHGAIKLDCSPSDWRWERSDNPLCHRPKSDAKALGTLVHCLLLEGRAAFDKQFCREPDRALYPNALDGGKELSARLKKLEAEHCVKLGVDKLKQDERKPFLSSGTVEELVGRIRALEPDAQFWPEIVADHVADRTLIDEEEERYAVMASSLALRAYGDLLEIDYGEGLSEVSIFWTEIVSGEPVRFKARWDRITASRIIDLKKYGTIPKPQHSLRQHLVAQAASYSYPVMAVLQTNAAIHLAKHLDDSEGNGMKFFGGTVEERALLAEIAERWSSRTPTFWWLFLRCPGPPGGKPIPFRPSDAMWVRASESIANAVFNLQRFRARFGDAIWIDAQDKEEISSEVGSESDWPAWAWKTPMEAR